jgi:hypothetical protein
MALLFLRAPRGKELEDRPLGIQRMSLREGAQEIDIKNSNLKFKSLLDSLERECL